MSIETIIMAVALWCGNPSTYGGSVVTAEHVNECRARLINCITKLQTDNVAGKSCFEAEKLK